MTGNGSQGAMVFGDRITKRLYSTTGGSTCRFTIPASTGYRLDPAADPQLLADGEYQEAADGVVVLANAEGYKGKHWTDPFIPACDLKLGMPPALSVTTSVGGFQHRRGRRIVGAMTADALSAGFSSSARMT